MQLPYTKNDRIVNSSVKQINKYSSVHSRINSNHTDLKPIKSGTKVSIDMSSIQGPDLAQHRASMPSIEDTDSMYNAYKLKNIKK